ncbi:MAG: hypothetical protein R2825_13935 [Saprospiraceae bacterium]
MRQTILYILLQFLSLQIFSQQIIDLSNFKYREVGPYRGGRVTTVTGVDTQPNVFYMGATGAGIWKTEDYGTTWKNVSDGFLETPSIGAIRVAKNDPNIIYATARNGRPSQQYYCRKSVYKSVDAGKTWKISASKKRGTSAAWKFIQPTITSCL